MDRKLFPQLLAHPETGQPMLHVPWASRGHVTVIVSEDDLVPSIPVIEVLTSADLIRVSINGRNWTAAHE